MIRCIVYSPSRIRAELRLDEIASANKSIVSKSRESLRVVTDTEEWIWVNPELDSARGKRAEKALIDSMCSNRAFDNIIIPSCYGYCTDIQFFE